MLGSSCRWDTCGLGLRKTNGFQDAQMSSGRLTVCSIVPSGTPDTLRVEAAMDGKPVVFNAQFIPMHFGDQPVWFITFDIAYWVMYKFRSKHIA